MPEIMIDVTEKAAVLSAPSVIVCGIGTLLS